MQRYKMEKLTYSQFVKRYTRTTSVPKQYTEEEDYFLEEIKLKLEHADIDNEDYIFTGQTPIVGEKYLKLPRYIPINGLMGKEWLLLRKLLALRMHKHKKSENPHEYYYSEMQLYTPFRHESELIPEDLSKCKQKYEKNIKTILNIKGQVMKHLAEVEKGRERAEEILANEIGNILDPANEQENEDAAAEEVILEHPDLHVLDPGDIANTAESNQQVYRRTDLINDDELSVKILKLDKDQRMVIDVGVNYAKKYLQANKNNLARPKAPLVIVHGGAGTGKSTVIDALSSVTEKIFRKAGDDPNHPYILRTAFTGNAALIIKGQTLHTAFNLPFGNEVLSLSDKLRDERRTLLQNLKLLIIDEISLVKSDILYQIHFRLMKDIFQNESLFGGVAVFVFGDILQIKPTKGNFIFGTPYDKRLQLYYHVEDIWKKFEVINLKTNHRQGDDKTYADLLNRIRVGEQTEEDIKLLSTRVFDKYDKSIPRDALHISGTNAAVEKVNNTRLSQIDQKELELDAIVFSETRGNFVPPLDKKKDIRGTTLQYNLKLKVGCRVMLTYNLDVCDGLTNGSQGTVVAIEKENQEIQSISWLNLMLRKVVQKEENGLI